MENRIIDLLQLFRIKHWVKNVFIFLPMFFGAKLLDEECWINSLWAFLAFSLMASAVYCINDVRDAEEDCRHPEKCNRPVASGSVSKPVAITLSIILAIISLLMGILSFDENNGAIFLVLLSYMILNIAYSFLLKRKSIIDVFMISLFFVLRVVMGGLACDIEPTAWIIIMVFLLSLMLALAKRRDDILIFNSTGESIRKSSEEYNLNYIDQCISIMSAVMIVCYIMYTLSPATMMRFGTEYMYVSAIFVLGGLMRYIQLTIVQKDSGSPTKIAFSDHPLQLCVAGWVLFYIIVIYVDK